MTAKGIDKLAPGALALVGVLLSGAAFASARFEASAGDAPTQPTSLDGVAKSSSRVRLTWVDNSENESSFEVQYKEIPGRWMDAGSVEAGVEHATVSGLTPAAKYKFRVRAVNSFGKSKWSNRLRLTLSIERPNILLIISDDQGIDASSQYSVGDDLPNTPVLDALAQSGIVFDEAWATPACTTTRGTLISGLHGVRSGIDFVPAALPSTVRTLHTHFAEHAPDYATAVIGKWHLGGRSTDLNGPSNAGVGYYAGTIDGVIDDYFDWTLTTEGAQSAQSTYHTTAMTDLAIEWLDVQTGPWFMWLAYVAPHEPLHAPPDALHDRSLVGTPADIRANRRDYYLAAIEAMDHEIGRLLDSLSSAERANTLVVFIGDNGTPALAVDAAVFDAAHAKNSLYEGGIRVPFVVSGAGVSRAGVRESALVHTVDIFPTLLQILGAPAPEEPFDGESFADVLTGSDVGRRAFNYTEFISSDVTGWAVRDSRYKLIEFADGPRELYDLSVDLAEQNDLIDDATLSERVEQLAAYGALRRGE